MSACDEIDWFRRFPDGGTGYVRPDGTTDSPKSPGSTARPACNCGPCQREAAERSAPIPYLRRHVAEAIYDGLGIYNRPDADRAANLVVEMLRPELERLAFERDFAQANLNEYIQQLQDLRDDYLTGEPVPVTEVVPATKRELERLSTDLGRLVLTAIDSWSADETVRAEQVDAAEHVIRRDRATASTMGAESWQLIRKQRDEARALLRGMARRVGEYRQAARAEADLLDALQAQYNQAVEDWGRNDEAMLAENQRLVDEVTRLTEIIRKSDAVDKHNLQAELKQRNRRYGIASATIGRLRGDLARARQERNSHIEHGSSFAAEAERLRGELRLASDRHERETAQIRGELRIEEDNVAFAEKTLHMVLQCCNGEQDSCAALETVYGYVRCGEKPPIAEAVVLPADAADQLHSALEVTAGVHTGAQLADQTDTVLALIRSWSAPSPEGGTADA